MINLQNMQVKNGSTWQKICPFPVGFVYSSYTNTSPGSTFGGTWTPITGLFPYFNAGTSIGGSNTHTHGLSSNAYAKLRWDFTNNPNIQFQYRNDTWGGNVSGVLIEWTSVGRAKVATLGVSNKSTALGGSTDSGSNMPAYQTLYAWRRTA